MARHKEFEVNEVLDKAMYLFWSQGYEKTSMQDLVETMGIHRRSIYDTFGDKHSLFTKALQRYEFLQTQNIKRLIKDQQPAKEMIRLFLEATIQQKGTPQGCLMVNSATELGILDPEIASFVENSYAKTELFLFNIIVNGQKNGEIASRLDAEKLAHYVLNAWLGLRVMVKTTTDSQKMIDIIQTTLSILD